LFWIDEDQIINFEHPETFFKKDWIISLYKYKDKTIKTAIWQMKYRSNRHISKIFGQKMAEKLVKNKLENYTLVPIPIHWRRRLERGFNQSDWLCLEIIKVFPKIKFKKVLKRVIYSKKQSWNNKLMRLKNTHSVFKIKNKFKKEIIGNNFLLIDDVVTTGATLKEARQELLIHGASSVRALTIAC